MYNIDSSNVLNKIEVIIMARLKTLKQEYRQAVKNGYQGSYEDFLKLQKKYCDALLSILDKVK